MSFRKTLTASVALSLILAIQGCASTITTDDETRMIVQGGWQPFDSVEELTDWAELVVVGTVGEWVGRYEIFDIDQATGEKVLAKADEVYEFRVTEVLAGEVKVGEVIFIGAADFGTPVANATIFTPKEELLLFLAPFSFGGELNGWVPLSSDTGVFELTNGQARTRGVVGQLAGSVRDIETLRATVAAAAGQ